MNIVKITKVSLISILCIGASVYFALSFAKFCYCDMKFHTQEEAMIAALIHLSQGNVIAPSINSARQAENYLKANPDCCRRSRGVGEAVHYQIWDVLLSRAAHVVEIVAPMSESLSRNGVDYEAYVRVSCGIVTVSTGQSISRI